MKEQRHRHKYVTHKINNDPESIAKSICKNPISIHNINITDNWANVNCVRCLSMKRKEEEKAGRLQ